jgi:hypothetical protein
MFPTAQQPQSEMTNAGWRCPELTPLILTKCAEGKAKIGLEEGIKETYAWFLENEFK